MQICSKQICAGAEGRLSDPGSMDGFELAIHGPGKAVVANTRRRAYLFTLRHQPIGRYFTFFVGEDREDALLNVYNKLYSNQYQIPSVVTNWLVKPVEVDDVPVVMPGLWSDQPDRYGDFELRRFADEITTYLQQIPDTNQVTSTTARGLNQENTTPPRNTTQSQEILKL